MKFGKIKVSNIAQGIKLRAICDKCGCLLTHEMHKCTCTKNHGVTIQVLTPPDSNYKGGWEDEEYVCCGEAMRPTGLENCNGWKCMKCHYSIEDVASGKFDPPGIKWRKEPENTCDETEYGFLHWESECKKYQIRYKYTGGTDLWTLMYMPSRKTWTRIGISEDKTCKGLAEGYRRHVNHIS